MNYPHPLVSVLVPVFNAGEYVMAAVRSILLQSYDNFELLLLDDGSTDGTSELVRDAACLDSRVKVSLRPRLGITPSLNELISQAQGEFIARLDADDIAYPERLRSQVEYLGRKSEVGVVSCWTHQVTEDGASITCLCYPDDSQWIHRQLETGRNPIIHSSVMLRIDVLRNMEGPYRTRYLQDLDLWLRLLPVTKFGIVPELLIASRQHPGSLSSTNTKNRLRLHDFIMELHRRRCRGLNDDGWYEVEQELLARASPTTSEDKKTATRHYLAGLASQMNNVDREVTRSYFRRAVRERTLFPKAILRYLLTFLPDQLSDRLLAINYLRKRRYGPLPEYFRRLDDVLSSEQRTHFEEFWREVNKPPELEGSG